MATPVTIIGSVVLLSEMYIALYLLLTPRFSKFKTVLLLILSCVVSHTGYFYPYLSTARMLIPNIAAYLIILVTYKNKWIQTTLLYVTGLILEAFVEFINILVQPNGVMADWPNGFSVQYQIALYALFAFSYAILLTIFITIVKRHRQNSSDFFKTRESIIFAVLLLTEMVIIACIFKIACEDLSSSRFVLLLTIILSLIIADIAVLISFTSISKRLQEANRAALLEQMVQSQTEYYAALTEQQESIRAMRHDIANHILTMKILLKQSKEEDVAEYLDNLDEKYKRRSELGNCLNPTVDAFVYHKICQLRERDIPVTTHIEIPEHLDISNTDLISAFGNLIDNCTEACETVENPSINITAYVRSGFLCIETENPLPFAVPEEKKRRIPELERGVGTHILNSLAERYDGRFNSFSENGKYKADLMLKAIT